MMKTYAQINAAGVCVGLTEAADTINAPHMIAINPGEAQIGQRWTGKAWETPEQTAQELAQKELEAIDKEMGMPRALRELLIGIADKVGADATYLKAQEARAAKARAKFKA